jgi:uncharacterized protein (UPF0333 family)
MPKLLLTGIVFFLFFDSFSQVGIGTSNPSASAILDVTSTSKGLLPPRMSTSQRNGITSPANGLTIYNVDISALQFFNGTTWNTLPNFLNTSGSAGQVLVFSTSGAATWTTIIREVADQFSATANQTSFTLTQAPHVNSKVKMFVNGVRISNTAYSISSTTLTYNPLNNGGYALTAGDRIQFDYYY